VMLVEMRVGTGTGGQTRRGPGCARRIDGDLNGCRIA
jgi:hypothetical protein